MGKAHYPTLKASRTLECGLEAALMAGLYQQTWYFNVFQYAGDENDLHTCPNIKILKHIIVWQRYGNIRGIMEYLIFHVFQ